MMTIEAREGDLIRIEATGTLTDDDYDRLIPLVDERIERHRDVRIVVDMVGLEGLTPGAAIEDARLGVRHAGDVERLAAIGDARWQAWVTRLAEPFVNADVRFFGADEREAALAWIHEGT